MTVLVLLLGALSSSATAEVIENLVHRSYVVHPAAGQSLLAALDEASPVRQDGEVFHGHGTWDIRWDFRWTADASGPCRIVSSRTTVHAVILLPELEGGTSEQQHRFEVYAAALREHERGHYRIGRDAARAIDDHLLTLPPAQDCSALERAGNNGARRILEEHQARERSYDAATAHGSTQGALLKE